MGIFGLYLMGEVLITGNNKGLVSKSISKDIK